MKSCPTGQVHGHSKELPHRALGPAPACFKEDKGRGPSPTLEAQSLHIPSKFQPLKYFFGWQRDCDWRHSVLHCSLRQAMTMIQGQVGQRGREQKETQEQPWPCSKSFGETCWFQSWGFSLTPATRLGSLGSDTPSQWDVLQGCRCP